MGTEYTAGLVVGFIISYETVQTVLGKIVEERIRYEDRFNQKTGKKLAKKEEIVEPGGSVLVTPDSELPFDDYPNEIAKALGERFDCECEVSARAYGDVYALSFSLPNDGTEWVSDTDGGDFSIGSSAVLKSMEGLHDRLLPLKQRSLDAGFTNEDVGEPRMAVSWWVDG